MMSYITFGILLGMFFVASHCAINKHVFKDDYKDLFDAIYRSFMHAAGIVLGACTVYYAVTGKYPLGSTEENLRLPISIGGSMLIVESFRSQLKVFREK